MPLDDLTMYCFACWAELEPCLARAGSLFCHEHRDPHFRDVAAGGPPTSAPTPLIVEPSSLAARENAEVPA